MTAAIAIYAALVSTLAVAWQVYAWRQQRKTHVRVWLEFEHQRPLFAIGDETNIEDTTVSEDYIRPTVINETDRPVRITEAFLEVAETGTRVDLSQWLAKVIPPHDSHEVRSIASSAEERGFKLSESIRASVRTATGETFHSNRIRLTK
jgi:hypothetical protein